MDHAFEVQRQAAVANADPQVFQGMAAGAQTVGIEQEKLADILKDVNDRVGDFLTTGGGPMADFFESIAPKVYPMGWTPPGGIECANVVGVETLLRGERLW